MNLRAHFLFAITALAISAPVSHASTSLLMAAPYNVFVLGDFQASNSDVEGALAAGGSINLNNYAVGQAFPANTTLWTLVAGNDFTGSNGSVRGKVYDGTPGGISGSFTITSGNLTDIGPSPIDFALAAEQLRARSTLIAAAPSTGSCTGNYYYLDCHATNPGINVFNITADQLPYFESGHAPRIISDYPGATVILNLATDNITLTNGGWSFEGIDSTRVIINYTGSSLQFAGSVPVSLLAPWADVTSSYGAFNGRFIANSYSGNVQFNDQPFAGDFGNAFTPQTPPITSGNPTVPEPGTYALLSGALVLFIAGRRKLGAMLRS